MTHYSFEKFLGIASLIIVLIIGVSQFSKPQLGSPNTMVVYAP